MAPEIPIQLTKNTRTVSSIQYGVFAALLILILTLLQIPSLQHFPAAHVDESWNANRSWNYLRTGENTTTIDVGPRPEGRGVGTPALATTILAGSYRLFGLGLLQTRIPSVLFGVILLLAVYWLGKNLYNPMVGLLALLILGLSLPFIETSHRGRPDVAVAALAAVAFGSAVWGAKTNKGIGHAVAGVLVTVSIAVHQNGLIFAISLAAVYLALMGWRFWRQRGFWIFILGGLLGLLVSGSVFNLIHTVLATVLPGSIDTVQSTAQGLGGVHRPPILDLTPTLFVQSFLAELRRYRVFEPGLDTLLIAASLLYLVWRRNRGDRILLAFVSTAFLLYILLVHNKDYYYAIQLYPYLFIAVAATFIGLLQSKPHRIRRLVVGAVLACFVLLTLAQSALTLYRARNYDYYAITAQIRTVVPSEARVMGYPTWWLGLHETDYRSTFTLTDYHYLKGYTLTEGIEAFRPDYFIVDEGFRSLLKDEGYFPETTGFAVYWLPRQEFDDFLTQRGTQLLEFSDPWQGRISVYKIDWN